MTVQHPAKFSANVILEIKYLVCQELLSLNHPYTVLDPFAGVGGIHELRDWNTCVNVKTVGVELEPEWATQSPHTLVGNALELPFRDLSFDAIITSPCYGNRMADHHNAQDGSKRMTYTHQLQRELTPGNSGVLQWGDQYQRFHYEAWGEAVRVLKPKGLFVVNIKNHIRGGMLQRVAEWHLMDLIGWGLELQEVRKVQCPGMGFGANREARVKYERVLVLRKP